MKVLRTRQRLPILASMACLLATPALAATSTDSGLFDLYARNRAEGVPNLITPDLLLVSYSLIRERSAIEQEQRVLLPTFTALSSELATAMKPKSGKEVLRQKAYAYAVLLNSLLTDTPPPDIKGLALQEEWRLIGEASQITTSPLLGIPMDYSQFKPRGRYTASPELGRYFKALRYAGTAHFYSQGSAATGVSSEQALELTHVATLLADRVAHTPSLQDKHSKLLQALRWEYGDSVDLSNDELLAVTTAKDFDWKNAPQAAHAVHAYAVSHQRLPTVFDKPVDVSKLSDGQTTADVLLGWRLVPATYSAQAAATQAVIYPATGTFSNPCQGLNCVQPWTLGVLDGKPAKAYLRSIELLAALQMPQAVAISHFNGEDRFAGYAQALDKAANLLLHANGLAGEQMRFLQSGSRFESRPESLLAFNTWQRYIGLLYQKQSMTMGAKGLPAPDSARPGAQLLGQAGYYEALQTLVKAHLAQDNSKNWQDFAQLLDKLTVLAGSTGTRSADDEAFLNGLDRQLLQLTGKKDTPIVVDIHTDPVTAQVQEEGIGKPEIVQADKARGGRLSYFEFRQPLAERLDNERWTQAVLRD